MRRSLRKRVVPISLLIPFVGLVGLGAAKGPFAAAREVAGAAQASAAETRSESGRFSLRGAVSVEHPLAGRERSEGVASNGVRYRLDLDASARGPATKSCLCDLPLFADGFESGNTNMWSSSTP